MAQPDTKKGSLKCKVDGSWVKRSISLERGVLVIHKEKDPTPLVTIPVEEFSDNGITSKGKEFFIDTKNTRLEFRTKSPKDAQEWFNALLTAHQSTSRPTPSTPSRPSALPPPTFTTAEKRSGMEKKDSNIDGFGTARAKMTDRGRPILGSSNFLPTAASTGGIGSNSGSLPNVFHSTRSNEEKSGGHDEKLEKSKGNDEKLEKSKGYEEKLEKSRNNEDMLEKSRNEEKSRSNEEKSRNDEKLEKLQQQLQEANKNLQSYKDQFHQLQTEVTKKEQNSQKLEAQLVELRGKLMGKDSEVDTLKESIKMKAAETAALHSQLNEASTQSTSVSDQQKNIEGLTLSLSQQEEKIGTLDALVSKLTHEKEEKEQKIKSQQQTIQKQNTELQEKEHTLSEIKGILEKKEKEYHILSEQIKENHKKDSDSGHQLEVKINEYNQLLVKYQEIQNQQITLKSERDQYQSQSTQKSTELQKIEKELISEQKNTENLDRENKLKDLKIDQLTRSSEDLKRQVTETSERINSFMNSGNSDARESELLSQIETKTREVREKTSELDAKENILCELKIHRDELQRKNSEFSEKFVLKENQVKGLMVELEDGKKKWNESQSSLERALLENTQLIQKLNQNQSENKDKNVISKKDDKSLQLLVDNLKKELQNKQEMETSRKMEIETLTRKLRKKEEKIKSLKSVRSSSEKGKNPEIRPPSYPNLGFVTSPEGVAQQINEKVEPPSDSTTSPIPALEAKIRSLEVIKRAIETENNTKDNCIELLNQTIKSQAEQIETVVQLETRIDRLEKKIARKQEFIADLKNRVYLSRKREAMFEQMNDETQSKVTAALREEIESKETTLQNLREKLDTAYETISEPESLLRKNNEMKHTNQILKLDLELRKRELEETKKAISELRGLFHQAYENGTVPLGEFGLEREGEERLKKAVNGIKGVEAQLGKVTADRDRLILELRKMERALESAKKVAQIERNFLDLLKKVDTKLKDKKDVSQELRTRIQKDTEEKKTLIAKISVLKIAYQKLLEEREHDRKEFSATIEAKTKQLETHVKRLKAELARAKKTEPSSTPTSTTTTTPTTTPITITDSATDSSPRKNNSTRDKQKMDQSPRKRRSGPKPSHSPTGTTPSITPRGSMSVIPGPTIKVVPGVVDLKESEDYDIKSQSVPQVSESGGSFSDSLKIRSDGKRFSRDQRVPLKRTSHQQVHEVIDTELHGSDKPVGNPFDDA